MVSMTCEIIRPRKEAQNGNNNKPRETKAGAEIPDCG